MAQATLAKYISRGHFPGNSVRSLAQLEKYARRYGRTSYHPVPKCKLFAVRHWIGA
jgi:choline dehydrogenase